MRYAAGIDIGSTYTKALVLNDNDELVGRAMLPTGFQLAEVAERALHAAIEAAGVTRDDVAGKRALAPRARSSTWAARP